MIDFPSPGVGLVTIIDRTGLSSQENSRFVLIERYVSVTGSLSFMFDMSFISRSELFPELLICILLNVLFSFGLLGNLFSLLGLISGTIPIIGSSKIWVTSSSLLIVLSINSFIKAIPNPKTSPSIIPKVALRVVFRGIGIVGKIAGSMILIPPVPVADFIFASSPFSKRKLNRFSATIFDRDNRDISIISSNKSGCCFLNFILIWV